MSSPLVDVSALWVRFGPVDAVRGIGFTVNAGSATALLGRNGAGKSTTMRVLAGVIPPTGGIVTVCRRICFEGRYWARCALTVSARVDRWVI